MGARPRLLVVGTPGYRRGGNLRCLRSIREYSKFFDVYLVTPLSHIPELLEEKVLERLSSYNVRLAGYFYNSLTTRFPSAENFLTKYMVPSIFPKVYRIRLFKECKFDAVFVEHENLDYVLSGAILSHEEEIPAGVLLQNPPFLGNPERAKNLLRAHLTWRALAADSSLESFLSEAKIVYRISTWNRLIKNTYDLLFKRYNLVLGVTKATIVEMGDSYLARSGFRFLNPGVALDEEDIACISRVGKNPEKKPLVLFKGGPSVEKGLLDALLAFKLILKDRKDVKLYVTSISHPIIMEKARKICRKLNIENQVVFTGFLDRMDLFRLTAEARLVLHPSHMDAFSYAVAESLSLGTPVVAYDIPAMRIYFAGLKGMFIVKEGDIDALAGESVRVLEEPKVEAEAPRLKSWEEIMREEVDLIKGLLLH
jgi:glycosyltransferase involved in cell wall biosynthesis